MLHRSFVEEHDIGWGTRKMSFLLVSLDFLDDRNVMLTLLLDSIKRFAESLEDILVHLKVIALGVMRMIVIMMVVCIIIITVMIVIVMDEILFMKISLLFLLNGMTLSMDMIGMTWGRGSVEVIASTIAV